MKKTKPNTNFFEYLKETQKKFTHLKKYFDLVGEALLLSTDQRYRLQISPLGVRWAPNSHVTIQRYISKRRGFTKPSKGKSRTLNVKGLLSLQSKQILRDRGTLQDLMHYRSTNKKLFVGPSIAASSYSRMMHFGGKKVNYPKLWGDIPARPYLGVTKADKAKMIKLFGTYLNK